MSAKRLPSNPFSHSLRARVTFGVGLPLVLILGALVAIQSARYREAVLSNVSQLAAHSGKVVEYSLRHEMLESHTTEVQTLLDLIGETEQFRVVYLLDTSGTVIFAPNGEAVGTQLGNQQPDCQPCHSFSPEVRRESVVVTAGDGQRVFRSMHPIENGPECAGCHSADERLLGLLLTDIPMAPLEASLAADLRENLLWWAGMILVTAIVVNLAMNRLVVRRLEGLAKALARFGRERLDLRLPAGDADEIGQLAAAFNEMGRRVADEAAENRTLSEHLRHQSAQRGELLKRLISAQEDERKRVARELHDELGQALGGLGLQIEAMERLVATDPDRALEHLGHMRPLITETTERMYDLILALRPSALDDLGLTAALRAHAERLLARTGIAFELDASGLTDRLPPEMETALYRTFQEALSNVVRHAAARQVSVTLAQHNGCFVGEIVDDGQGFDPQDVQVNRDSPRGLGLLGMQERITQCGGKLEITSRPGSGTRICMRIPLPEATYG